MCAQSCLTLCNSMDCRPPALLSMVFSGKNTGMGCHFFLQGIFPILGSNLCLLRLLHWQVDSLPLSGKLLWPSINFKLLKKKKTIRINWELYYADSLAPSSSLWSKSLSLLKNTYLLKAVQWFWGATKIETSASTSSPLTRELVAATCTPTLPCHQPGPLLLPANDNNYLSILTLLAEKAMAPHSSALAWKIPWIEEPGGLPSMGSHRVGHDWWLSSSSSNLTWPPRQFCRWWLFPFFKLHRSCLLGHNHLLVLGFYPIYGFLFFFSKLRGFLCLVLKCFRGLIKPLI